MMSAGGLEVVGTDRVDTAGDLLALHHSAVSSWQRTVDGLGGGEALSDKGRGGGGVEAAPTRQQLAPRGNQDCRW